MAINRKQILDDVINACGISFDFSDKNDLDFCKEIISIDCNYIQFLPMEMLDNKEIAMLALKEVDSFDVYNVFSPLSDRLQDDEEIVRLAIGKNPIVICDASERLKDDFEFMSYCCKLELNSVAHASERLRDDDDFILPIIEKDPLNICFASERVRNNLDLFLKYFNKYPEVLRSAGTKIISDIGLMKKCFKIPKVKSYFVELCEKNPSLGDDKDIVMKCISRSKEVFPMASNRLKNDKEVCKKAVDKDIMAYREISDEMKKNKDFAIYCVKKDCNFFYHLIKEFREDKNIFLLALKNSFEMCYFKDYIPNNLFDELKNLTVDNAVIKLESIIAEEELNKVLIITSKQNKIKL